MQATEVGSGGGGSNGGAGGSHVTFNVGEVRILILYNIVESGIKHHNPNPIKIISIHTSEIVRYLYSSYIYCYGGDSCKSYFPFYLQQVTDKLYHILLY
jgi:hypothetical protein